MKNTAISAIHRQMIDAFGHEVKIHTLGGIEPVVGKCINYTQPLDNEPEVASIDIRVHGYSGLTELTEYEIESIELLD